MRMASKNLARRDCESVTGKDLPKGAGQKGSGFALTFGDKLRDPVSAWHTDRKAQ
jgi:hypothetical protein